MLVHHYSIWPGSTPLFIAERGVDFSSAVKFTCCSANLIANARRTLEKKKRRNDSKSVGSGDAVSKGPITRGLTLPDLEADYKNWTKHKDGWSGGRKRHRRAAVGKEIENVGKITRRRAAHLRIQTAASVMALGFNQTNSFCASRHTPIKHCTRRSASALWKASKID